MNHLASCPTICIDFKNPKAYLALQPTYALEAELGIAFDWLPLIVSAMGRPHPERANEDRGSRHRRMRAQYYEPDLRRYASAYRDSILETCTATRTRRSRASACCG